jgi:hypothetical protein
MTQTGAIYYATGVSLPDSTAEVEQQLREAAKSAFAEYLSDITERQAQGARESEKRSRDLCYGILGVYPTLTLNRDFWVGTIKFVTRCEDYRFTIHLAQTCQMCGLEVPSRPIHALADLGELLDDFGPSARFHNCKADRPEEKDSARALAEALTAFLRDYDPDDGEVL